MCFLLIPTEEDREWTEEADEPPDSSIGSSHDTDSWLLSLR
jgi:hypothetical protein